MNPLGPRNPEAGSCPSAPASLEEPVKGENLLCLELCRCEGALWGRRAMCFRVCVFGTVAGFCFLSCAVRTLLSLVFAQDFHSCCHRAD